MTDDQEYVDEIESQLLPRIYLKALTILLSQIPKVDPAAVTSLEESVKAEELNYFRQHVMDVMKKAIMDSAKNMKGTISF